MGTPEVLVKEGKYEEIVEILYGQSGGDRGNEKAHPPEARLRMVAQRVTQKLDKRKTYEELQMENEELAREKEQLNDQLEVVKEENRSVVRVNANLENALNQDPRENVMEAVESFLRTSYPGLGNKVTIEKDLGVLRIPSEIVSFPVNKKEIAKGEDVLSLLAKMLWNIAEFDKKNQLVSGHNHPLIDNIVIECHADKDGDDDLNEELSSNRALYVWKLMNLFTVNSLNRMTNSKGLGLFSHAGYGKRVPVPRLWGESEDSVEYKVRYRRIDIRFNCGPVKNK